jgi:hypothetical protein
MSIFQSLVSSELESSRSKFEPLHTAHEAYAVILEELDEFWDQVRLHPLKRSDERMLKELVQVAAMAQRTAEDLGLLD